MFHPGESRLQSRINRSCSARPGAVGDVQHGGVEFPMVGRTPRPRCEPRPTLFPLWGATPRRIPVRLRPGSSR